MRQVVVTSALAVSFLASGAASVADAKDSERLGHKRSAWTQPGFKKVRKAAMSFADSYRRFIDSHRTEREVVEAALKEARAKGYQDLFADKRPKVSKGASLYAQQHGKIAAFVRVGSEPLSKGVHLVAAHIDAVRIDLKQTPLYADGNLAMLETHYYGGIKRYQWLSQPLELRGVVVKKNGTRVDVAIGDEESEPVLVIPDIAAHLSYYVDNEEGEELPGERLDPVVASTPAARGKGDLFAAEAKRLIEKELGISLSDLASAELELVPAASPRDVGLDRALIGGYGQDDRACAYAALQALWSAKQPKHTAIVLLLDKEEVGSAGNSGAQSSFLQRVVAELLEGQGTTSTAANISKVFANSLVFSADVSGAVNPHYPKLYDKKNAAFTGSGIIWDQSAVHAELLAYVRKLLDDAGVSHQPANWGKTRGSKGDTGTVLEFFTRLGMNGLDVSIPLLSMHSTFELISKADLYEGYRAYQAFLQD